MASLLFSPLLNLQSLILELPPTNDFLLPTFSFSLLPSPLRDNADRRPQKTVFRTDLIFQVPQIGKVHQLGIIDIDHERRRIGTDLGAVEHLQLPSRVGGRSEEHTS